MSKVIRPVFVMGAILGAPLLAQHASGVEVSASILQGLNSYKRMTNDTTGFGVAMGWKTHLEKAGFDMRVLAGYHDMPGKTFITTKTSLKHLQVAADFYMATWTKELTWFMGISGNKYTASNSGYEVMGVGQSMTTGPKVNAIDAFSVRSGEDDQGIKFGLRFGLNYAINDRWAVEVIFQQTELSGGIHVEPNQDPKYPAGYSNRGHMNPGWLNIGAKYSF